MNVLRPVSVFTFGSRRDAPFPLVDNFIKVIVKINWQESVYTFEYVSYTSSITLGSHGWPLSYIFSFKRYLVCMPGFVVVEV